jgi:hypothetical protein
MNRKHRSRPAALGGVAILATASLTSAEARQTAPYTPAYEIVSTEHILHPGQAGEQLVWGF